MEIPKIDTFDAATDFVSFARMMKSDLPDGQWEDLKEIIIDYRESYGKETDTWPESAKETFTEQVRENMLSWL